MESTHSGPRSLGDFEIIREIGRGGMGIVYEARQRSLNRRVALKVLSSGLGLTTKAVTRFRREAEAAAKLHHTNIVPIYATGEEHGIHFYAMELVEGPSLDQVIRHMRDGDTGTSSTQELDSTIDSPVPDALPNWVSETMAYKPEGAVSSSATAGKTSDTTGSGISSGTQYFDHVASMIADVADALQHAHDEGVIHRDIKPSNLLLSADGRISLNDFGLARILEQPGMTMSGEFVGSPLYMSPEQITAGRAPLDHRTDIYSLGATLYELLTLKPPFPGQQRDQVIGQILHKDPVSPRRSNRRVPADLETICLKALEKDPDRRYQTARQMADDLRRFVNRFAISARRIGLIGRVGKWVRRNRAVSALLLVIVIIVAFTVAVQYRQGRIRQRQFEGLKEDTLLSALTGNYQHARSLLKRAEELNAPRGWVFLMEGQIKMLEGKYSEARFDLDRASAALGENTAVYAMQSLNYFVSGEEEEFLRRFATLRQMKAEGFQDHLLRGWAFAVSFPHLAKEEFAQARQRRGGDQSESQVLLVLESIALTRAAIDTTNPIEAQMDIERAIQSTSAARILNQKDPLAISWHVMANCVAARIYCELGDGTKASACLASVPGDLESLKQWPELADGRWARAIYFEQQGQIGQMFADLDDDVRHEVVVDNYTTLWCAAKYYAQPDLDKCQWALEQIHGKYRDITRYARAYVTLGRMQNEADRSRFLDEYVREISYRLQGESGLYFDFDWTVLRLAGDDEHAKRFADGYAAVVRHIFDDRPRLTAAGYMSSDRPDESLEQDLVDCSKNSQSDLCRAHFLIGCNRLGRGDREGAAGHFRAAVQTRYRETIYFWWCQAFLENVDDPDWLPWLNTTK